MDTVLNTSWFALPLVVQMANIGNEVKRAIRFDNNQKKKAMFLDKAIKYTDLTISDPKNYHVIPELEISKNLLEDYKKDQMNYATPEQVGRYYANFVYLMKS